MTTEWRNEFCSFNSWKGLLYVPWYEAIKSGKFLPPIEASLDLIHSCNLSCNACNASRYTKNSYQMERRMIPSGHLFKLIDFLAEWGVKAGCWGGGGESTLHPDCAESIRYANKKGLKPAIATNGTLFNDNLIDAMANHCRWVGISVDAATKETYFKNKKKSLFDTVLVNIKLLVYWVNKFKTNCDVAYKFLIYPSNENEIYDACKIAKDLGVRDFHARPCNLHHQGMAFLDKEFGSYNIPKILEQFEKCHKLEDDNFRVATVMHKYDKNFAPRKDFDQCYAMPICIQICADGVYACPDTRFNEFYKLGDHYPDPRQILTFWGKEKHQKLVFETGKIHCKSRCTFSPYNRQCQELYMKNDDPMCKYFV